MYTKVLHSLSEQAQGSYNGPLFPRSILNLVLLMLGQLSRCGGKKEEEGLGTRPLHELKLSYEPGLSVLDFV